MINTERIEQNYPLDRESAVALQMTAFVSSDHIGTEHLLFGLLKTNSGSEIVRKLEKDPIKMAEDTLEYIKSDPNHPETDHGVTQTVIDTFTHAREVMEENGSMSISPKHIMIGLLMSKPGMGFLILNGSDPGNTEARENAKQELLERIARL